MSARSRYEEQLALLRAAQDNVKFFNDAKADVIESQAAAATAIELARKSAETASHYAEASADSSVVSAIKAREAADSATSAQGSAAHAEALAAKIAMLEGSSRVAVREIFEKLLQAEVAYENISTTRATSNQIKSELEELRLKVTTLIGQVSDNAADSTAKSTAISALETQASAAIATINGLVASFKLQQTEGAAILKKIEVLRDAAKEHAAQAEASKDRIVKLEGDATEMVAKIASGLQGAEATFEKISAKTGVLDAIEKKLKSLKESATELVASISDDASTASAEVTKIEGFQAAASTAITTINDLVASGKLQQAEGVRLVDEIKNLMGSAEKLKIDTQGSAAAAKKSAEQADNDASNASDSAKTAQEAADIASNAAANATASQEAAKVSAASAHASQLAANNSAVEAEAIAVRMQKLQDKAAANARAVADIKIEAQDYLKAVNATKFEADEILIGLNKLEAAAQGLFVQMNSTHVNVTAVSAEVAAIQNKTQALAKNINATADQSAKAAAEAKNLQEGINAIRSDAESTAADLAEIGDSAGAKVIATVNSVVQGAWNTVEGLFRLPVYEGADQQSLPKSADSNQPEVVVCDNITSPTNVTFQPEIDPFTSPISKEQDCAYIEKYCAREYGSENTSNDACLIAHRCSGGLSDAIANAFDGVTS